MYKFIIKYLLKFKFFNFHIKFIYKFHEQHNIIQTDKSKKGIVKLFVISSIEGVLRPKSHWTMFKKCGSIVQRQSSLYRNSFFFISFCFYVWYFVRKIYAYIYRYICDNKDIYVCLCMYLYVYKYICVYIYIGVYVRVRVCMLICIYMYICVCVH